MKASAVPSASRGPEAWRTISERTGNQAKCSFLLSVLSSDSATEHERSRAFASLLDDIQAIAGALDQGDVIRLGDVLQEAIRATRANPAWSTTLYPDDSVCSADLIDGTNVQRVVVPRAGGGATGIDVGRVDIPACGRVTIVSEYTFDSDDRARLEVVDESTGLVLGAAKLDKGYGRLATTVIEVADDLQVTPVRLRVTNESGADEVLWYHSTIYSSQVGAGERLGGVVPKPLDSGGTATTPNSVFVPITREPLTLDDVDRLSALRNKFWGERIFIMGNGPSLNKTPLDLLENDYVFGVNRVSLLFDRISWRPTFFTAFDVRVVPDNREEFANIDVPYKFFSARYKGLLGERDNHFWYHTKGHYEGFEASFESTVLYSGFGGGGTIGVIAVELAFFMGFREIYLIGTDVSYAIPKSVKQAGLDQFGDGVKLELQSTKDDDPNHFDPRYFGRNKKWHNPNVREMKIGLARAAAYVERRGGVLRNATVGGALDEVERVDFGSLF